MSSLNGHLSLFATQSLKSIDKWMNTVQANLTGSVRNAYKESTLTYGGNNVNILKETSMMQNGIQIGEQALSVGNTKLNWGNGEIVGSTQETHFAIQGNGFFIVADTRNMVGNAVLGYPDSTNTHKSYLTKDGEFHWAIVSNVNANDPILVNSEGLAVQGDFSGGAGIGSSDDIMHCILKSSFDSTNKERPAVVQPCKDPAFNTGAPTNVIEYDDLQYSKYGSTILEAPTAKTFKTIVNGTAGNLDRRNVADPEGSGSVLIEKALEGSNVKVEANIVELAALGKVYNGFVQVIKVYNSTLDEVLGFIR